ncbi:MAG: methylated-DNA--[protein]-cysteine S-methyltransferase [Firmicutes bacterium]|nr:methylated-DNA--[protein]-cysteine S-methyltransferase [Bacillota bacterium]
MYKKIQIKKEEIDHLKNSDENMKKLIDKVGDIDRSYIPNHFLALVNSIVFQQLAYNAANAIWNRLISIYDKVTPENVLNTDNEILRECGLSRTKISYIKNISQAIIDDKINLEKINTLSNEEIINNLTEIKGIGIWTAEMFLIFSLNRKNVLSYKDLGIRKGIKWLYGMKKEPTEKQFSKIKEKFSPYNTLASFYLWEITLKNLHTYDDIDSIDNNVTYLKSPIGLIELQSNKGKIVRLDFVKKKRHKEKNDFILEKAKNQLVQYFEGLRRDFTLPLEIKGTNFQTKVWNELKNIPYGETYSYKDIAVNIENENACRAVGNANNKNKIPIIIPCHRVIGANGKLVGYGGELWRKEWLLNHENNKG